MGLAGLLSGQDVEDIRRFVYSYSGTEMGHVNKVLETWANNKTDLYALLGNSLRYTFEAEVSDDDEIINDDLNTYLGYFLCLSGLTAEQIKEFLASYTETSSCDFYKSVMWHIYRKYQDDEKVMSDAYTCAYSLLCFDNIRSNFVDSPLLFRGLYIPSGTKTMKAIRKFLEHIDYDDWDEFNLFKDDISTIRTPCQLSVRKITLSIHPADFLTLSDNDCDWRSCFSWESGECSNSTIEAMNSQNVLVAYIQNADQPMMKNYPTIPNKSWRSMEVVDTCNDIAIVTGKGYPYKSNELQKVILSELSRLCGIKDSDQSFYKFDADYSMVNMVTYGMYNDWAESSADFFLQPLGEQPDNYESIQVSWPQTCMMCGEIVTNAPEIKNEIVGGTQKVCRSCYEKYHCDVCGINHFDKDMIKVRMLSGDGIVSWKNACVESLKKEYFYIRSLDLYIDKTVYIFSPEVAVFYGDLSWMDDPQFEDVRTFRLLTQKVKQRYDEAKIWYMPVKKCYLGQLLSEPIEANRLLDTPLEKMYNGEDKSRVRLSTRRDQLRMFAHDYNNFTEVIEPEDRYMHFSTVRASKRV